MDILRNIKLSRVQLSIVIVLLSLIIIVVLAFNSDDTLKINIKPRNDQSLSEGLVNSLRTDNQAQVVQAQTFQTLIEPLDTDSNDSHLESTFSESNIAPINSLSALDDEILLNISDILENSLVPVFLSNNQNTNQTLDQNMAIDVFVSRLPEGMLGTDFQQINLLLRDYLPYDVADSLALKAEEKYRLNEQEQAYLSSAFPDNTSPESMAQQIQTAKHLDSLKSGELQQQPDYDLEASQAYLDWQKTQEKLKNIQSSSSDPEQDTFNILKAEYGSDVANDYLELSNAEKAWQEKYANFLTEKNIITESGLSDEDKAEQIENLIQHHYDENEWAAARAYDAMMQGQPES